MDPGDLPHRQAQTAGQRPAAPPIATGREQHANGLEASLELALDHQWQVSANAARGQARYDDFSETRDGIAYNRAGKHPSNVPQLSANLWLSKGFGHQVQTGLGLRYVDERYTNTAKVAPRRHAGGGIHSTWRPL